MGSSVKALELHALLRRQFFKKPVEEEAVSLVSPLSYLAMTVCRGAWSLMLSWASGYNP